MDEHVIDPDELIRRRFSFLIKKPGGMRKLADFNRADLQTLWGKGPPVSARHIAPNLCLLCGCSIQAEDLIRTGLVRGKNRNKKPSYQQFLCHNSCYEHSVKALGVTAHGGNSDVHANTS